MINVTNNIAINEDEIQLDFIRSSGPGGQHVNKVATAVQLRFDVANSPSLSDAVRARLTQIAGSRITEDGILVILARQYRSQEQNRRDAINRLTDLIRTATKPPKPRRKTKPTQASRQRRLAAKRRRSEIKRWRRSIDD